MDAASILNLKLRNGKNHRHLENTMYPKKYCDLNTWSSYRKSRSVRWVQNMACMGQKKNTHRVLVGKHVGNNHSDDQDIDGRIILKWISKK